jgi:HEPN domain-containing protein
MTRGKPRTRPVAPHQVIQFLHKAEEFLSTAQEALREGWHSPAAGNAVHSGINACDAILGARIGERSSGQDHDQAVELIATLPDIGRDASNRLKRLLSLKTKAEYDPAPVSAADAAQACERAVALVNLARTVVFDRFGDTSRR